MSQDVLPETLPSGWRALRLKRCVERIAVRAEAQDGVPFVGLESIESGVGRLVPEANEETQADALQFRRADVLFGKLRPYLAKAWLAEFDGRCSSELLVLRPRSLAPEFLRHWVLSREFIEAVDRSTYGTKMPRAEWDFIGNLPAPVPPSPRQRAIAAFLDHETARIDALTTTKERLLALLDEKRTALITRAVTKGLDPTVPMKASGVEWLGEVPAHWIVAPLYSRYEVALGKMLDQKRISGDHLAPYIRNVNVQWDRVTIDALPTMDFEPDERPRYRLHPGDLLVCEGGEVGRTAIWRGEVDECYYQKAVHRLRPKRPGEHPRFFYYVMYAAAKLGVFVATGNPNTIDHLTADQLSHHRFAFPPRKEQTTIARALDQETDRLDALASKVRDAIALLREYRTALISAAVTGQIDVSGEVDGGRGDGYEGLKSQLGREAS